MQITKEMSMTQAVTSLMGKQRSLYVYATANANTPQQGAAWTLLHLYGSALSGKPNGDMNKYTNENRSQFAQSGCPNINKPSWSKPWEKTSNAHRGNTNLPENANANVTQNKHVYPPSNIQNTIASLTGAIDSFQQQHFNMHTRQETITTHLSMSHQHCSSLGATITLPLKIKIVI